MTLAESQSFLDEDDDTEARKRRGIMTDALTLLYKRHFEITPKSRLLFHRTARSFAGKITDTFLAEFDTTWLELCYRMTLDARTYDFGHSTLLSRLAAPTGQQKLDRLHFDAAQEISWLRAQCSDRLTRIMMMEDRVTEQDIQIASLHKSNAELTTFLEHRRQSLSNGAHAPQKRGRGISTPHSSAQLASKNAGSR